MDRARKTVLVVDDEAPILSLVAGILRDRGCEVRTTSSGKAALKIAEESAPDLVLLDVDMPGMTGYELCNKLRRLPMHKKTPVVFVTRLDDFNNRTKSMMAGGNDFIAKQFLFIELTVKALIHVLRGKFQPANDRESSGFLLPTS